MVYAYCSIACDLMDTQTPGNRFAPLDYAVSQKILPIISGVGEQYKKLLTELQDECASLPSCSSHISRMIKAAEDMGFYQFFTR